MMKKVLSLLLLITMLVSIGSFAVMAADGSFPDVSGEHTNLEAIKHYAEAGVINGYPDGTFKPGEPITRGEFVKMLMVYAGNEKANTAGVVTGFPDVDAAEGKEAHWAHPHIKTAVDLKIINGYPDGTFRPDDNVKYEEAIKMMVCYLGKESVAKDRADAANIALYPEGYIRVANENLMNINISSSLGGNASRADVAQILYNSKDIKRVTQTQTGGGSFGGGSFGGGGGGGSISIPSGGNETTYTLEQSMTIGRNWSGSRDGIVVAASKLDSNDIKQQYFLEGYDEITGEFTGLTTREGLCDTISAYQLIVKMDVPIAGNSYVLFTNSSRNKVYYDYLGHHVSVNFLYNGSANGFYINAISSLQESDTIGSVSSATILKGRTDAFNASLAPEEDYGIVYYNASSDKEITLKLPRDLNSLKVIYNERLVKTSEIPLNIEDFIPDNGTISYVKADRRTYRLIRITDFDTYVVGSKITSVPRGITDKYRKEADGTTPLRLILDDRAGSGVDLIIKDSSGKKIEVSSIPKGSVLTVAKSKCEKFINVSVYSKSLSKQKIVGMSEGDGSGEKPGITFDSTMTKWYPYSEYYKAYVKDGVDIEINDRVTVYLNSAGEITWLEETEPTYTIGYLVNAWEETTQEQSVIKAKIMTAGATKFETYNITNTTKIGTPSVEGETYIAGTKTKYSDMEEVLTVLKARADIINEGKSGYSINAEFAQPIRYVLSGNNIEILETMALDTDNKFTGSSMTYSVDEGNKFSGNNVQFGASSDAMYIFVPNNREWAANIYKMGDASKVSSKLINYGKYNIEPYFLPNANGGFARKVFVIYNENIDAEPNYRSETIIVESKIAGLDANGGAIYTVTPKSGYGNSKSSYTVSTSNFDNAFVLDANFERMVDEQGNPITREVKKGDVIRFGYTPGGSMKNIEIVFDISEALEGRKKVAFDTSGNMVDYDSFQYKSLIHYYGRVGLITYVPDNPEFCRLSVGVGQTSELFIENYTTRSVLLNTYAADGSSTFEVKTMDDLNPGDMVYVWQYYSGRLTIKYIYAVRYEEDLMSQYNAENAPTPDPGTGEEPSEPGEGGGSSEPDNGGSEPTNPEEGGGPLPDSGTDEEPTEPDSGNE
ncbi:MAG: S-layer homology domain-containing protein [Clostridia bacterium]|nr:S-layer homology domain-containing protein [Clostridia bacterium]